MLTYTISNAYAHMLFFNRQILSIQLCAGLSNCFFVLLIISLQLADLPEVLAWLL